MKLHALTQAARSYTLLHHAKPTWTPRQKRGANMGGEGLRDFITGLFSAKFVTMMLHDVTACAEIFQAFSFHIRTGSD